jgi:AAA domain
MIDGGKWTPDNEKLVLKIRDAIITESLKAGKHVICDDTNFVDKHQDRLRQLASESGASFEIKDFSDVPLEECLARDKKRPNYVGEAVIMKMWNQFLKPVPPVIPVNPDLPYCVIVDIDGTVALMNGRGPFDWHSVGTDLPNEPVCHLVRGIRDKVIFVSGRDAVCRAATEKWLMDQDLIGGCDLYMRPERDMRDDRIIKEEIYRREIEGKYTVRYVLDDRPKINRMWKSLGLFVFDCGHGIEF